MKEKKAQTLKTEDFKNKIQVFFLCFLNRGAPEPRSAGGVCFLHHGRAL